MAWAIDGGFLKAFQIEFGPPADPSALATVETALGGPLPDFVRGWYAAADGGVARAPRSELQLLSLDRVQGWFDGTPLAKRGQFPFAENNDSNPICLCCKGPLAGYVVQTPHDGEPRVMFRTPAAFFRAAAEMLERGEQLDTHDLATDFTVPARTAEDVRIARELVQLVQASDKPKGMSAGVSLLFAIELLDDPREIRAVADLGSEYVWSCAFRRLDGMGSAEALAAVSEMRETFDAFVETCAQQLVRAGFGAVVEAPYGRKSIRIDPQDIGLNMPMFFARRGQPDLEQYLVERVRHLVALEDEPPVAP